MTAGKGKRAVIINNIKSGTIEQAIFILKPPACESNISAGSVIVAEAQEIINSYISRVEGPKPFYRKQSIFKSTAFFVIASALLSVILTAVAISLI